MTAPRIISGILLIGACLIVAGSSILAGIGGALVSVGVLLVAFGFEAVREYNG